MPELPDLQAFSYNLTKIFKGKKLDKIEVTEDRKLNVPKVELQHALQGQEVDKFVRIGKELHLLFRGGHVLGLHLMLHGQFVVFGSKDKQPGHQVIRLEFDDDINLALTDFQKAATPTLDPQENDTPDALDIESEYLIQKLAKTKTPVKTVLMDQKVVRGIGNAYADEILWHARLSPFSPSNKVPPAKIKTLVSAIKDVLHDAEKKILIAEPNIISGEVRDFMEVHNYKKKQTSTGAVIHQKELSSRKTYYTDEQELFS